MEPKRFDVEITERGFIFLRCPLCRTYLIIDEDQFFGKKVVKCDTCDYYDVNEWNKTMVIDNRFKNI